MVCCQEMNQEKKEICWGSSASGEVNFPQAVRLERIHYSGLESQDMTVLGGGE